MKEENKKQPYQKLAEELDKLPNKFPRTSSGVEIQILKRIFNPEEARLASKLSGDLEPIPSIVERVDLSEEELKTKLDGMSSSGLVWKDGSKYRLAPFIVGIMEEQWSVMDHELAHLIEIYMREGGAEGIMGPNPALHRVVPAHGSVTERVLPYEDVKKILLDAESYAVRDCICRKQQRLIDEGCDYPLRACLIFSSTEQDTDAEEGVSEEPISQEEALNILEKAEKIGLVHTVTNVTEGLEYVCNCCGCCCEMLRGINEWGIENSVAETSYYAKIDSEKCQECDTCIDRCQINAISKNNEGPVVNQEKCIGCGLCVTGCPHDAAYLKQKPEKERTQPPKNYTEWERERNS